LEKQGRKSPGCWKNRLSKEWFYVEQRRWTRGQKWWGYKLCSWLLSRNEGCLELKFKAVNVTCDNVSAWCPWPETLWFWIEIDKVMIWWKKFHGNKASCQQLHISGEINLIHSSYHEQTVEYTDCKNVQFD
jgi:hypothetical protein